MFIKNKEKKKGEERGCFRFMDNSDLSFLVKEGKSGLFVSSLKEILLRIEERAWGDGEETYYNYYSLFLSSFLKNLSNFEDKEIEEIEIILEGILQKMTSPWFFYLNFEKFYSDNLKIINGYMWHQSKTTEDVARRLMVSLKRKRELNLVKEEERWFFVNNVSNFAEWALQKLGPEK